MSKGIRVSKVPKADHLNLKQGDYPQATGFYVAFVDKGSVKIVTTSVEKEPTVYVRDNYDPTLSPIVLTKGDRLVIGLFSDERKCLEYDGSKLNGFSLSDEELEVLRSNYVEGEKPAPRRTPLMDAAKEVSEGITSDFRKKD